MVEMEESAKAFATFRVLNGEANESERDQLFRNMAQLFSYVSERCDDEQVAQYDEVLCQLAELVESEARAHVAGVLSRLDRAPGTVVVKLASDTIDVARPLLEFSNVLSDDDLIEIVHNKSEDHRVAIATREAVGERVGEAIVDRGGRASVVELVRNKAAQLGEGTLEKLVERASKDSELAADLRGRTEVDWNGLRNEISVAGGKVLEQLGLVEVLSNRSTLGTVSAMVYNRIRNSAGFNAREWKLSWNQVKALSDRRQLDVKALSRFARFGYGHHAAAALTMLLQVSPEVLVKWLATQDYVALTVACRAYGLPNDLFEGLVTVMPWRDFPEMEEVRNVGTYFDALSREEAIGIFDLWRAHAFRKRPTEEERAVAVA